VHILLVEDDRVALAVHAGGAAAPIADDSEPPELRWLSVSTRSRRCGCACRT
jgi:hypothetical protein